MLCGRFEYFGSYPGNLRFLQARIGVTGRGDGWGSAGRGIARCLMIGADQNFQMILSIKINPIFLIFVEYLLYY